MSPYKDGCYIPRRADVPSHTALGHTENAGQLFPAASSVQNLTSAGKQQPQAIGQVQQNPGSAG